MLRHSKSKKTNEVIQEFVKQGWVFSQNGHGRLTHPSGRYITLSLTPKCGHAYKNIKRDAKKLIEQLEKEKTNEPTQEN